jgi:hypothetical protein
VKAKEKKRKAKVQKGRACSHIIVSVTQKKDGKVSLDMPLLF